MRDQIEIASDGHLRGYVLVPWHRASALWPPDATYERLSGAELQWLVNRVVGSDPWVIHEVRDFLREHGLRTGKLAASSQSLHRILIDALDGPLPIVHTYRHVPPAHGSRLLRELEELEDALSEEPAGDHEAVFAIEVSLVDKETEAPVPHAPYEVHLPDKRIKRGRLNREGLAFVEGIPNGECEVIFPDHHEDAVQMD